MNNHKFIPKFALGIFLTFIFLTIVGTQLHELGHVAVAESLGYDTELHYGSTIWFYEGEFEDPYHIELQQLNDTYLHLPIDEIENLDPSIKQKAMDLMVKIEDKYPHNSIHEFWIALGGPLQTILTSFIGLWILLIRKSRLRTHFKFVDWIGVFLGLFILREVFNTVSGFISCVLYADCLFSGDEFRMSQLLGWNQWVLPVITMVFGSIIAYYILFVIVAKQYRCTFLIAGVIGGLVGYLLWFGGLGAWCFSLFN